MRFIILSLVTILILPSVLFADQVNDAKNAATGVGNMAIGKFGSKEGIRQNIATPVINSNTPMQTIDNSKSFNAQLVCPSSKEFLQVFVQPSGTGDLSTVIIRQDTNFDGVTDYSYAVPFLVSGVCSNGIISCAAGQWFPCKNYKWVADTSSKATLQEVPLSELGGCYCINSSCGSNLAWENLSIILKDLGGGIAGAIQVVYPKYAISDVKIQDTTVLYYGQDQKNCSYASTPTGSGSVNPEQYYSNPFQMNADVESLKISQSADPNSYYSMLMNSQANLPYATQVQNCTIKKTLSCAPNSLDSGVTVDDQCTAYESDSKCQLKEETVDGIITYRNYNPTGLTPLDSCKTSTCSGDCINDPKCTPGASVVVNFGTDGGKCSSSTSLTAQCNSDGQSFTWYTDGGVTVTGISGNYSIGAARSSCCGSLHPLTITSSATAGGYSYYMNRYDSCDGRWEPYGTAFTINFPFQCDVTGQFYDDAYACSQGCSYTANVCGWWEKKRTYTCKEKPYDFSDVQKRVESIKKTTKDNTADVYYKDYRKDEKTGTWVYEDKNVGLGTRDTYSDCEKACKVRRPKADTQASYSGHAAQYKTNTHAFDFFYKPCPHGTCPAGNGEEIVIDCQCINEFAEAASVMQTLRMAGQDLICSSGTPQEMK